jgi:hypothetical protein
MKKQILSLKHLFSCFVILSIFTTVGCKKKQVSNFISDGDRTTFELKIDGKKTNVFTETGPNRMALLVLDKAGSPTLLKISFPDSAGTQTTFIFQFQKEKTAKTPGTQLLDKEFINAIKGGDGQFDKWRKDYLSLPGDQYVKRVAILDTARKDPGGIKVTDGNTIALRIKNYLCSCKMGSIYGHCLNSALRCAMDKLCNIWGECVEKATWTPNCSSDLETAKVCLGEYQG